jgi:DNA repair exonuclease SbcCD nuclease subunit
MQTTFSAPWVNKPIRVLAVADTHVDDRMALAGLNPVDSETGEPLVLAQARRMMRWVGEVAREHEVDLIVHAGDLYERPRPSPAAERVAAEAIDDWCQVAPVVLLLGNHDRPHGEEAHALAPLRNRRPGRLYVADHPSPVVVNVEDLKAGDNHFGRIDLNDKSNDLRLAIFPVPYPSRSYLAEQVEGGADAVNAAVSEALQRVLTRHRVLAGEARRIGLQSMLLGHGTLRGANYCPHQTVPISDIQIGSEGFDAFDLVAWGHLHQRQGVSGWPETMHGYVGSPDAHDFGEEAEAKGVTIFDLDSEGGGAAHRFVEYPGARKFRTLTVEAFEEKFHVEAERASHADLCGETIYRVVGEVSPETFERVASRVRQLKTAGWIIRADCAVVRESRSRVEDSHEILGMEGAVKAACQSRPDLAPNTNTILARVAELRGAR